MPLRARTLAKISAPAVAEVLPRTRLFRELDKARKSSLVWIVAPPGAGKTTLVASYLSLFEADAKRSASVRARTDCEVAVITHDRFRALVQASPNLLPPLIGQIARRLRATSQKLGDLAFVDAAGRIARALLDLAADSQAVTHPQGKLVRITREELGRLVNCSREVAGRVLFDLEERGLIEAHGKNIVVRGGFLSSPGPASGGQPT